MKHKKEHKKVERETFSYHYDFFESGSLWNEDQWSKRLYHGLEKYLPPTYKVNYVAKDGKHFQNHNDTDLFIFRGSPDLIFTWHGNHTSAAAVITDVFTVPGDVCEENEPDDVDDTDTCSTSSVVASAENMLQRSPILEISGIPAYEKTGELIANLHILAVQMMLKCHNTTMPSITVGGILLDKLYGIIQCKVVFPIHGFNDTSAVNPHNPQLDISSSLRGALKVDGLCYYLNRLFEDNYDHLVNLLLYALCFVLMN